MGKIVSFFTKILGVLQLIVKHTQFLAWILLFFTITFSSVSFANDSTITYPINNFDRIAFSGNFAAKINYANNYSIVISGEKDVIKNLSIQKVKDTLVLLQRTSFWAKQGLLKAEITLPKLNGLGLTGKANLIFNGFKTDNLYFNNSSDGKIIGNNNYIKNLTLISTAASDIDLTQNIINNAILHLESYSKLKIKITHGSLTGDAKGASQIIYSGTPKSVNVGIFGMSKVIGLK